MKKRTRLLETRKEKAEIVKLIFELTDEQLSWVIAQLPSVLTEEQQKLFRQVVG